MLGLGKLEIMSANQASNISGDVCVYVLYCILILAYKDMVLDVTSLVLITKNLVEIPPSIYVKKSIF